MINSSDSTDSIKPVYITLLLAPSLTRTPFVDMRHTRVYASIKQVAAAEFTYVDASGMNVDA
jgi:hypothetical protein